MDLIRRIVGFFRSPKDTPTAVAPKFEDASSNNTPAPVKSIADRRQEIETFVRNIVSRIEGAVALGITTPDAIAAHFNESGLTTRKGRNWTGETVAKFLSSPGAKRYRSKTSE